MEAIDLKTILQTVHRVSIFTHVRPDGDAIGSSLGLQRILRTNTGLPVYLYCPDVIPAKYGYLPGVEHFRRDLEGSVKQDLVFVLDCSDLERLEYLKEKLQQHPRLVNIDHHVTNDFFGKYNLVDTRAAATGEMLYQLSRVWGFHVDFEASLCLYSAIASDTGSFKYDNTTPETLRITAELLQKGIQPSLVSQKLFDERPYTTLALLGEALKSLTLEQGGKIAWMRIDDNGIEKCGAKPEELDGFVNYLRDIENAEVGIFFYHARAGNTKVGFRSKSVDVARIASAFGGGGHPRAAGCTVEDAPSTVIKMVLNVVHAAVDEQQRERLIG